MSHRHGYARVGVKVDLTCGKFDWLECEVEQAYQKHGWPADPSDVVCANLQTICNENGVDFSIKSARIRLWDNNMFVFPSIGIVSAPLVDASVYGNAIGRSLMSGVVLKAMHSGLSPEEIFYAPLADDRSRNPNGTLSFFRRVEVGVLKKENLASYELLMRVIPDLDASRDLYCLDRTKVPEVLKTFRRFLETQTISCIVEPDVRWEMPCSWGEGIQEFATFAQTASLEDFLHGSTA